MITTSYAAPGSGERQACGQLRCAVTAPRMRARAEYLTARAARPRRSHPRAVVGLHLADLLVGAEEGVPRHVHGVAACRWLAAETLGERADVVRARAAAHTEVADTERERLAPEVGDLLPRAGEGIEPHGKGARVAEARVGERHERGL